jgi:hypothetical protein
LTPVRDELEKLLDGKVVVKFAPDCQKADALVAALQPGEILLLENLRFYADEEKVLTLVIVCRCILIECPSIRREISVIWNILRQ